MDTRATREPFLCFPAPASTVRPTLFRGFLESMARHSLPFPPCWAEDNLNGLCSGSLSEILIYYHAIPNVCPGLVAHVPNSLLDASI